MMTLFDPVLVLCTGNICRSPMAAALLHRALADDGASIDVDSAGLGAVVDAHADPLAIELMGESGLDIGGHRGRQFVADDAHRYRLLLVMESAQRDRVLSLCPLAQGRVHRLGRFGDFDVPDPYRGTRADFEAALALIERGVRDWVRCIRGMPLER